MKDSFPVKIALFTFLLISNFLFSQEEIFELPTIIPPSPTAFQMTQYGDVPINESTGNISPSIPVFHYQAGRLQVPISLNYQGNGVKVDQAASWTGINWNLNAGGVIARTVKGLDDLVPLGPQGSRNAYSYQNLNSMTLSTAFVGTSAFADNAVVNTHITATNVDSEADIFSFSFPGYSGSFYLDKDLHPHLTKDDSPLKIYINPEIPQVNDIPQLLKREIQITTPDGVTYYFGGLTASEVSEVHQQLTHSFFLPPAAQTSFYLYKIQHPMGDVVYFDYTNDYSYNLEISHSESYTKYVSQEGFCDEPPINNYDQNRTTILENQITNRISLSRIHSNKNDYEVVFNSSNVDPNNTAISIHYTNVLNSIIVRHVTDINDIVKKANLNYIYPHNGIVNNPSVAQRFFLENVTFTDGGTNTEYSYQMDYNSPEHLPARFSFDQDHLGYYNNRGNTRYIPKTDHPKFASIYSTLADKSPVFIYATKGTLTKISYPTGGHTEFEYESGKTEDYASESKYTHFLTYINDGSRLPNDQNPKSVNIGLPSIDEIDNNGNSVIIDETILAQKINVRLSNVYSTGFLDNHTLFRLKIYDQTTSNEVTYDKRFNQNEGIVKEDYYYPPNNIVYSYPEYIYKNFYLTYGHQYTISLEIIPRSDNDQNSPINSEAINANIHFNYDIATNDLQDDLGIRIKRVTDYLSSNYDASDPVAKIKRYYYLSGTDNIKPQYLYASKVGTSCPIGSMISEGTHNLINLVSSSTQSVYANASNQKMYNKVKISFGGDNFENGAVLKEFIIRKDGLPINYFNTDDTYNLTSARENRSTINGTLKKETIFSLKEDDLRAVSETQNYYTIDDYSERFTNNVKSKLYNVFLDPHTRLDHLYLGLYETISNKVILDSTITKIYDYSKIVILDADNDGIPDNEDPDANGNGIVDAGEDFDNDGIINLFDNDDDGNGILDVDEPEQQPDVIESITKYQYGEYSGLPTKVTTGTSQDLLSHETTNIYPTLELVQNATEYGDIGELIQYNQVSRPLETQSYKVLYPNVPELLSTVRSVYSNTFNNYTGAGTLLSGVKVAKGNNSLEDRIIYHDYDQLGNPLEVSKADGTHMVYIWGYNQTQPIAKIENATYLDIPSGLIADVQNKSNADDDRKVDLINPDGSITPIGKEGILRQALNNLRNESTLSNALIATYTYDPLTGVTSITDPRGNVIYYDYDDFNRLKHVKDKDGNILSENQYNYANQN